MNKQESNTSFHLKGESTKTGKLPVSEQYLEDKEIQDQTEQLKNQTDISTEGLTETAILRLKAEQTSANKSNGISGATYSISTSYHEAVGEQQASLTRQRKNRHTFAIVRKTITLVVIFAILVAGIYFLSTHLRNLKPHDDKSMQELLCESKWTIEDLGIFIFTEDNKVIKKKGSTETGTYEVTDDDILIMHFKKEDLSYLLETSSDGTVKWVHSYNGFEEVIIPNTIPITK